MEQREKILWSMSLGVSELRTGFSTVLLQVTPIWIARWMLRDLFRWRIGCRFNGTRLKKLGWDKRKDGRKSK
jgi:hypothetical protein